MPCVVMIFLSVYTQLPILHSYKRTYRMNTVGLFYSKNMIYYIFKMDRFLFECIGITNTHLPSRITIDRFFLFSGRTKKPCLPLTPKFLLIRFILSHFYFVQTCRQKFLNKLNIMIITKYLNNDT